MEERACDHVRMTIKRCMSELKTLHARREDLAFDLERLDNDIKHQEELLASCGALLDIVEKYNGYA